MTAFFLLFGGIPGHAGPIENDVGICGVSFPYDRFGEPAPGFFGNSTTGLKDQFFRIRGYLNIEANEWKIAEFISALQIRGVRMCVRGNLETVQKSDKLFFYYVPKSFDIQEKHDAYMDLAELSAVYRLSRTSSLVSIISFVDIDTLAKFRLGDVDLVDFTTTSKNFTCPDLEANLAELPNSILKVTRIDKITFTADAAVPCSASKDHPDILKFHFVFGRVASMNSVRLERVRGQESSTITIPLQQVRRLAPITQ